MSARTRTQHAPASAPRRARPPVEAVTDQPPTRWRVTTVIAVIVATTLLFGLVGFQTLIVGSQSTIDDLDAQIAAATRENQRLRLDVAELESPERIRLYAIAILGMVEPQTVEYLEPLTAAELGQGGSG